MPELVWDFISYLKMSVSIVFFVKSMGPGASDKFNYLSLNSGFATYNFSFLLYGQE